MLKILIALVTSLPLASLLVSSEGLETVQKQLGKEVVLRGFVVPLDEGGWAICSEVPIRSCCRGKIAQGGIKIPLDGDWAHLEPEKVREFRGKLVASEESQHDAAMRLIHAKLETSKRHNTPFYTWLVGTGFLVVGVTLLWRRIGAQHS